MEEKEKKEKMEKMGWTCPTCGKNNAPSVAHCPCTEKSPVDEAREVLKAINDGQVSLLPFYQDKVDIDLGNG